MSDLKKTLRKLVNKTTVCSNTSEGEKTVYMDSIDDFEQIVESLLSKQRASLIKEFEGVIGEDETESKKDKMGFNNLWKHRNLLRIQQRRRLKAIKDTNEVAEEEENK